MEPATRLEAARAAVDAARGVPDVHDLDGGAMGTFGTMGAGEHVAGLRVDARRRRAEVRVVARLGTPLPALAGRVRDAVAGALEEHGADASWSVDVRITDLVPDQPALEGEA